MSVIDWVIYIGLGVSSFINILVPISGSATITAALSLITDPHRAIGLASFYFMLSGPVRIWLFRKHIEWSEVKSLLPISVLFATIGGLSLVTINDTLLLTIILLFSVYFLIKKLGWKKQNNLSKHTTRFVGALSGFLQGTGLAGSDLRNGYLYGKKLDLATVHGTTAIVGMSNFFVASMGRLYTEQITITDVIPLLYLFPIIVLGSWLGKKALYKLDKKTTDRIIVLVMSLIIIFLAQKVFLNVSIL